MQINKAIAETSSLRERLALIEADLARVENSIARIPAREPELPSEEQAADNLRRLCATYLFCEPETFVKKPETHGDILRRHAAAWAVYHAWRLPIRKVGPLVGMADHSTVYRTVTQIGKAYARYIDAHEDDQDTPERQWVYPQMQALLKALEARRMDANFRGANAADYSCAMRASLEYLKDEAGQADDAG